MNIHSSRILLFAGGLLLAAYQPLHADNVIFTGEGADNLWSTTGNWTTFPVAGNELSSFTLDNATAANPAIVDSGFNVTMGVVRIESFEAANDPSGRVYVEIADGGTLRTRNVIVGQGGRAAYQGSLTLRSGGAITNDGTGGLDPGFLQIGHSTSASNTPANRSFLTVESGATLQAPRIDLRLGGVITFQFGTDSVTTLQTTRASEGQNVLDGLLQVDLANLEVMQTYSLITNPNAGVTIGGSLRTWLDTESGAFSGTGSFANSNFEVLNGGSFDWTLSLDNNNQDLVLTVIPEPGTLGLVAIAGLVTYLTRFRRRK
ncbi:MAG: PEP-CTERM sorting domain-containing protein [Verrucomicrobia bacterium]|nr:PEP-CTERM sorting domain-containing protein [Verrucomicrobiota bacterium]